MLNQTPQGERIHIAFFGNRNAGKSSLVNAITGQSLSIVSDKKGTTTDPVYKAMELLPLGPVMVIDTPGLDDSGELGKLRVEKTNEILNKTDIAVLVVDGTDKDNSIDEIIAAIKEKNIPYVVAINKTDLLNDLSAVDVNKYGENIIFVSATENKNIHELKEMIGHLVKDEANNKFILADLVKTMDTVVLVIPIDSAAPKGRIILPQQQVLRELLEIGAITVAVKETELADTLDKLKKVDLVITDSQAFEEVSAIVPEHIKLTSFSILLARYKGYLETAVQGVKSIDTLKDGDKILISEGCTHHRQCEDIGTVKIPNWLKKYTGKNLHIETTSGREFPKDLSKYSLIIHCGGCMLNEKEVKHRMNEAISQGIPFTNYGVVIAYMKGIIDRSII